MNPTLIKLLYYASQFLYTFQFLHILCLSSFHILHIFMFTIFTVFLDNFTHFYAYIFSLFYNFDNVYILLQPHYTIQPNQCAEFL
jgi:hypothetical protein